MSVFSSILNTVFNRAGATPPATPVVAPAPGAAPAAAAPAPAAPSAPVDVIAVCTALAAQKGGGGNWQTSIVDLLKLLDLDSSLTARKELATELGVRAGADGTAEQNIALHRAVMASLFLNGGQVPANLRD